MVILKKKYFLNIHGQKPQYTLEWLYKFYSGIVAWYIKEKYCFTLFINEDYL